MATKIIENLDPDRNILPKPDCFIFFNTRKSDKISRKFVTQSFVIFYFRTNFRKILSGQASVRVSLTRVTRKCGRRKPDAIMMHREPALRKPATASDSELEMDRASPSLGVGLGPSRRESHGPSRSVAARNRTSRLMIDDSEQSPLRPRTE